jgi:hypothetical protein
MARRRSCWIQGSPPSLRIKALLRTGTNLSNYQYWVGGDRPTPFGPLPTVTTTAEEVIPRSIVSTGPGINDWVVCYHGGNFPSNESQDGINLAFADSTGIIKTRSVPFPSGTLPGLNSRSQGNFAWHFYTANSGSPDPSAIVYRWTSLAAEEATPRTGEAANPAIGFILPDVFLSESGGNSFNTYAVASPALDIAVAYTSGGGAFQRIYAPDGSFVTISPSITNLPTILAPNPVGLVGRSLYLVSSLGDGTSQATTEVLSRTLTTWTFALDGTYIAEATTTEYQSNSGYTRLDSSYHP